MRSYKLESCHKLMIGRYVIISKRIADSAHFSFSEREQLSCRPLVCYYMCHVICVTGYTATCCKEESFSSITAPCSTTFKALLPLPPRPVGQALIQLVSVVLNLGYYRVY